MSHSKDNWTVDLAVRETSYWLVESSVIQIVGDAVDWEAYWAVEVGVCHSAGTALHRSVDEVVKQPMVEA